MGVYSFKGQKEYEAYINNLPQRITYKGAVMAKCYECMGFYSDGKQDCQGYSCPLYPYYPYKNKKANNG